MTRINFIYPNGQMEWEQDELCPLIFICIKTSCNLLDSNSGIKSVFKTIQCHVGRKLSGKNPFLRSIQHEAHVN